ncbi:MULTISPECIES: chorismate mutase [Streptococcus]|jgi:chorismate mutase|uniref:Chorismate mutase n=3 Tax=Streptococcus mutans TaxID=1309 RepID=Q8DVF9_STRMU|nr:putative chorismate mutase [Streptococcus mutans UA159]ARC47839.1 chorismate mutase [Streptococcus gordonii]ARS61974.1 chorismate mutase [Streptococcus mutans]QNT16177.1 chorismate mutase [Streptococcus mutans B04Sm5]QZS44486.1 chorismate mutase [Streptococcus mutans OMZ175]RKV73604.1 MAG: chorismate mutase [Streptococcus sp.]
MQVIIMTSIQNLRNQIDQLDHQLLVLLAQRQQIVEKIGQLKPINSQAAVTAPDRVKQVLLNRQQEAEKLGLSPDVALAIWQTMIEAFTALELKINSNHDLNRK